MTTTAGTSFADAFAEYDATVAPAPVDGAPKAKTLRQVLPGATQETTRVLLATGRPVPDAETLAGDLEAMVIRDALKARDALIAALSSVVIDANTLKVWRTTRGRVQVNLPSVGESSSDDVWFSANLLVRFAGSLGTALGRDALQKPRAERK